MKYILEIGLETDLGLFDLEKKIKDVFLKEVDETFRNHVIVKIIEYEKIKDMFYKLEGINNGSGCGFHVRDKTKPKYFVVEEI